ncbi:MAG: ABC transporter ATP-binding protein [Epulopiscium sp.]|mgnify:CR=1 FL=1|nr:ABC transporter ATP-binding protein [Candidatus Epulonipiscium sp.]
MKILLKYLKQYYIPFLAAIICLSLETFIDLLQPTFMSRIVDIGVAAKDLDYIMKTGFIMLGITGAGAIMAIARSILATTISQKVGASLRLWLFTKVQSLSLKDIDNFDTGSLITRLTNDVTQVQNFVMGIMRIFVKAPLLFIGSIIMTFVLSPKMAFIIVILIPIISFLMYLNLKKAYPFFARVQRALDKVNIKMREYLQGVRVVKAYNQFDYEKESFDEVNLRLQETSKQSMELVAIFLPLITLVVNLGIVFILWLGGMEINKGNLQVGKIIAIVNYMIQILTSLIMISNIITTLVRTMTSLERIEDVLDTEDTITYDNQKDNWKIEKGRIDFINVHASYSKNTESNVLNDISFTCMPGETLGIIGSTGSGKTTLVHLIMGYYDYIKGSIKIDGQDISHINPKLIRNQVAIVSQKALLFSGTIKENILWGKKDASMDEIKNAAKIAQAHDFIDSFKGGYDTYLGQGGVNLSGGQKQRISIARAIIKRPKILILDDSTSAVDVTTEAKIRKGIGDFSKDMTTIIIAQRIQSIMGADQILVLENGEVVGKGNHEELIESCKVYQDIYDSQIGRTATVS